MINYMKKRRCDKEISIIISTLSNKKLWIEEGIFDYKDAEIVEMLLTGKSKSSVARELNTTIHYVERAEIKVLYAHRRKEMKDICRKGAKENEG